MLPLCSIRAPVSRWKGSAFMGAVVTFPTGAAWNRCPAVCVMTQSSIHHIQGPVDHLVRLLCNEGQRMSPSYSGLSPATCLAAVQHALQKGSQSGAEDIKRWRVCQFLWQLIPVVDRPRCSQFGPHGSSHWFLFCLSPPFGTWYLLPVKFLLPVTCQSYF